MPKKNPVAEFKLVVERFVPAYPQACKDAKFKLVAGENVHLDEKTAKFDVKKSDSMVSPYTAIISVDGGQEQIGMHWFGTYTFHFAYQDGKWVAQDGEFDGQSAEGVHANKAIGVSAAAMNKAMANAGL